MKISEYGLKIKNIKAGTLYGYNLGIRNRYDYTNAIFSNSLFSTFLQSHGMKVRKGESTRDIICLDFDFGSRSYEEEKAHVTAMLKKCTDEEEKTGLLNILNNVELNKLNYVKRSKEEIRELFYRDGVSVPYHRRDKDGTILETTVIHYRMLYRNSSKAKLGQVMFINEALYDIAYDWLTMGLGKKMPYENAKIVELSAYAPLTTSTITGTISIPAKDILILKDQDSFFKTIANVVTAEDYNATDRVIDEEKTENARLRAINSGKVDVHGNPIYKTIYKNVPVIKKRCMVQRRETEVKNTVWDGMGIIEDACLPDSVNGMALLRHHFFKMCGFRGKIQLFFREWCAKSGVDYETGEVKDMFGQSHRLKDIKVITTDNSIKWKKFSELMGSTPCEAYRYWCKKVKQNGSCFGIVKTDHSSKLGDVQQMSYQMINTLPCQKEDIRELAQTSIDYVESLKFDHDAFEAFLRKNANAVNHYEMMADLYRHNRNFAQSKWFRQEKRKIISSYVFKLRGGKITIPGDNLTACGNPYALLLYAVGEDWKNDPTFHCEPDVIQCYTTRFKNDEYLCAIRNPHNSPNNIAYLHNVYSPEMNRYFNFGSNIIAINCLGTDIQARCNGEDWDSDFNFVTNQSTMVSYAKLSYEQYPTIVNRLKESGLTYRNDPLEYAKMDNKFARSKRGIGESSNLAQLALTYYWTTPSDELYNNFVILSVLAQVVIDGCKREYEVDAFSEIERIKKMDCMNMQDGVECGDFPLFMKYTKEIPCTKNGNALPYGDVKEKREKLKSRINANLECPMNWLQEWLDRIQGSTQESTIPTESFFIKIPGKASPRQMTKIREACECYDRFIKENCERFSDDDFILEFTEVTETFYQLVRKVKIKNEVTINRLIETALSLDGENNNPHCQKGIGSKYSRRLLNTLYHMDKERFLLNFCTTD